MPATDRWHQASGCEHVRHTAPWASPRWATPVAPRCALGLTSPAPPHPAVNAASPLLLATQLEFTDVIAFERNGHVCTRALLSADELASVASSPPLLVLNTSTQCLVHNVKQLYVLLYSSQSSNASEPLVPLALLLPAQWRDQT